MTDDEQRGTRERILIAAASMLAEDASARLSVRAVAARAGVSTGSLRHFFPTQQALIDQVAAGIAGLVVDGEAFADRTRSPEQRLVAGMQQVLALIGTGEQARGIWRSNFEHYVAVEPSADASATFLALDRAGRRRIEGWLRELTEEGALAPGDDEQDARFLSSLLNGLAVERALPTDGARLSAEITTLRLAASAVLTRREPR